MLIDFDKACGPDKLHAEFVKHALSAIFENIADIMNQTAATGDTPTSLVHGLLLLLPKPEKPQGPWQFPFSKEYLVG